MNPSNLPPLEELYVRQLRDLFHAERQSIPALIALVEASDHFALRAAFGEHLEETCEHAERVEELLDDLEADTAGFSAAMAGLVRSCEKTLLEFPGQSALSTSIVLSAAQRIEHYEIAGYGSACTYARLLGEKEAAEVLERILDEECEADLRLVEIAEKLNGAALADALRAPHIKERKSHERQRNQTQSQGKLEPHQRTPEAVLR